MNDEIKEKIPFNVRDVLEDINSNILWNYITNLQQENERLSNFIHEFLDYCEECYADNKDNQDYPYCYIQKAEELIKKYKIGECDE